MNLASLQELDIQYFEEGVELELRYLTQLRLLSFCWPVSFAQDKLITFVESLGKLAKLEALVIFNGDDIDVMQDWVPAPYLRKLLLTGQFQTLPTWVNSSSLSLVSFLRIYVIELKPEDIEILGTLPTLRYVELWSILNVPTVDVATQRCMLSPNAFPCLRECNFKNVILGPHLFTPGAMPLVQKWTFRLRPSDILGGDMELSIWNLPSLEEVEITIHGENSTSEGREAEAAIRRTADDHPNCRLRIYISWYDLFD
jgi:disease resistance protein RPM1